MTIAQIECFLEIVKAGSITKAAESLFITQQAVSKQIQAVEKELGFPVFQRRKSGIELTEEGKILYAEWPKLHEIYRISVDKAYDMYVGREKVIHIGLADMGNCSEDILTALHEYEKRYSDLTVDYQILTPREMYYKLDIGKLDLAICYEGELEHMDFYRIPLHEKNLNMCIFLAKNHPLAREDITLADLRDVPLGMLNDVYSIDFKKKTKAFYEYSGLEVNPVRQEYDSRRNLEMALIAGRCMALVYETMFMDEGKKLFSKKMDFGHLSSRIALFWKSSDNTTKARTLAGILKEKLTRFN